jgi:5S rRNA maturation endonuclease (ribonuclease M5)
MINRAAIILTCKEPFVKWINDKDPYDDDPGITIKDANEDRNVYLITDADGENFEKWISINFKTLFENELEGWYTDESLWPRKRDRKTFDEWFSVECHTVIIDTVGSIIEDDET